ncbi:hypothetical protein F5I97DRAFT_1528421 [Phlebopus sp. FC_14]|nr:hypothetical protein F5I97DRAFT_1528421 [Phlebopus sp. FC_14]
MNRLRRAVSNTVRAHGRGVRPVDPDALADVDASWSDPARVYALDRSDPPQNLATFVSSRPADSPDIPTSPVSFYRNLLRLTSHAPFSIHTAVNYHFTYPKSYHSTRSFNLLISLALRHTAFGTAARLFNAMRSELVPPDLETWKLSVRWLVRTGRWEEAWNRVCSIMHHKDYKAQSTAPHHTSSMPLPLWLEFFHSQKRGALRRWCNDPTGHLAHRSNARVFRSSPTTSTTLQQSRYRALMSVLPPLSSFDHSQLSPRSVRIICLAMIQLGRRDLASSITSSFLHTLPSTLARCHQRAILDLIHMHIGTLPGKPGLSRHFAQRRLLFGFLDAHRGIRPSPTTLFLLLGSLRRCRRCGTLAMQCLRMFRKRWGPRVQSSMVRRRITSLALKEGRHDIARINIRAERNARALEAAWSSQREVLRVPLPRTLARKPWRSIFSRRGTENRRWHLLIKKLARSKKALGKFQQR